MVSFHTPLSLVTGKIVQESESLSKKRKWDDPSEMPAEKVKTVKPVFDAYVQRETPLPLEWQRCLDIKSGKIYFYNTRTHHKRTPSDPRILNPEPSNPSSMSLDLELNLPCGSLEKTMDIQEQGNNFMEQNSWGDAGPEPGLTRSPSWLTFEGEQQEMVTAVCKKCYMLVMMYKSSPACPNCKYMHPPDTSPNLFNPRLSLLC